MTNKQQKYGLLQISPLLIFTSGGMNFVLGLGWNLDGIIPNTLHYKFCWFIGVIIGLIIAAPLIKHIRKLYFMAISSALVLVCGILFVSLPYNYDAIIAARYINGIAVGLATVPYIVHFSEITEPKNRGSILSIEQYGYALGIFIQIFLAELIIWGIADYPSNRVNGIFGIVLGAVSIGMTLFIIESPIFYLQQNDETAALEVLRRVEGLEVATHEVELLLEEKKSYIRASEELTFVQSISPLLRMLFHRGVVAFTFSLPLSEAVEIASLISQGINLAWPLYIFAFLRFFGSIFPMFLTDLSGRKNLPLISLLIMAAILIVIGAMFYDVTNLLNTSMMSAVVGLGCCSQFFAGTFLASSTTYLGEAFPVHVKPYCVAFCILVEQIIHIVVICVFTFTAYSAFCYFISVGVISVGCFIYFMLTLPETKKLTLLDAQDRFQNFLHIKSAQF